MEATIGWRLQTGQVCFWRLPDDASADVLAACDSLIAEPLDDEESVRTEVEDVTDSRSAAALFAAGRPHALRVLFVEKAGDAPLRSSGEASAPALRSSFELDICIRNGTAAVRWESPLVAAQRGEGFVVCRRLGKITADSGAAGRASARLSRTVYRVSPLDAQDAVVKTVAAALHRGTAIAGPASGSLAAALLRLGPGWRSAAQAADGADDHAESDSDEDADAEDDLAAAAAAAADRADSVSWHASGSGVAAHAAPAGPAAASTGSSSAAPPSAAAAEGAAQLMARREWAAYHSVTAPLLAQRARLQSAQAPSSAPASAAQAHGGSGSGSGAAAGGVEAWTRAEKFQKYGRLKGLVDRSRSRIEAAVRAAEAAFLRRRQAVARVLQQQQHQQQKATAAAAGAAAGGAGAEGAAAAPAAPSPADVAAAAAAASPPLTEAEITALLTELDEEARALPQLPPAGDLPALAGSSLLTESERFAVIALIEAEADLYGEPEGGEDSDGAGADADADADAAFQAGAAGAAGDLSASAGAARLAAQSAALLGAAHAVDGSAAGSAGASAAAAASIAAASAQGAAAVGAGGSASEGRLRLAAALSTLTRHAEALAERIAAMDEQASKDSGDALKGAAGAGSGAASVERSAAGAAGAGSSTLEAAAAGAGRSTGAPLLAAVQILQRHAALHSHAHMDGEHESDHGPHHHHHDEHCEHGAAAGAAGTAAGEAAAVDERQASQAFLTKLLHHGKMEAAAKAGVAVRPLSDRAFDGGAGGGSGDK